METTEKFIGIDVSKDSLDVCVLALKEESYVIKNNKNAIVRFLKSKTNYDEDVHICFENTGKYSWALMELAEEFDFKFYMINPIHMKRSLGLVRGKNDKIDAIRIAQFIRKNHLEITPYIPKRKEVKLLHVLLSERRFKLNQRKQLLTKNKDLKYIGDKDLTKNLTSRNNKLIKQMTIQIKDLEEEIKILINNDSRLYKVNQQLKSIPGVGNVLSWNMIVKTNEFKSITDARKMACYSGVAPFANRSGTSVFGRNRVSFYADKSLKSLLHMGALSAVRVKNDLSIYYNRKVEEGKNKMSVLNAVRNKIVHIAFALIKHDAFFENKLVLP